MSKKIRIIIIIIKETGVLPASSIRIDYNRIIISDCFRLQPGQNQEQEIFFGVVACTGGAGIFTLLKVFRVVISPLNRVKSNFTPLMWLPASPGRGEDRIGSGRSSK